MKKKVLTYLDAPNGSQDISFRSQEFEQDGSHHFEGFHPHFHTKMTSQTQSYKKMKNESAISQDSFLRFSLKFCGLLKFSNEISLDLKFSILGTYNKNNKPLFKNKRPLFSHNKKSVS